MTTAYDAPISLLGLTTQAPQTLADAGIKTVGQLLDHNREAIADLRGMGAGRLADIEAALDKRGLTFGKPLYNPSKYRVCKACPACPHCSMPRATEARQVVVDYRGRHKHANAQGDPCNDCDAHHQALLAGAAA